jgi:hypothetical protein
MCSALCILEIPRYVSDYKDVISCLYGNVERVIQRWYSDIRDFYAENACSNLGSDTGYHNWSISWFHHYFHIPGMYFS